MPDPDSNVLAAHLPSVLGKIPDKKTPLSYEALVELLQSGAPVQHADLSAIDFSYKKLADIKQEHEYVKDVPAFFLFQQCDFHGANFSNAVLKNARFEACDFQDSCWSHATLENVFFKECDFTQAEINNIHGMVLDFSACTLTETQFIGSLITKSFFKKCRSDKTNFSDADLSLTTFMEEDCRTLIFNNTNLSRSNFFKADLRGQSFPCCHLAGTFLASSQLDDVDFRQATNIKQINLTQAQAPRTHFEGTACLGGIFVETDLTDAHFTQADISHSAFLKAILTRACLTQVQAKTTTFAQADMSYTRCHGANMMASNFVKANLTNADFSDTVLDFSNLHGIDETNTIWTGSRKFMLSHPKDNVNVAEAWKIPEHDI